MKRSHSDTYAMDCDWQSPRGMQYTSLGARFAKNPIISARRQEALDRLAEILANYQPAITTTNPANTAPLFPAMVRAEEALPMLVPAFCSHGEAAASTPSAPPQEVAQTVSAAPPQPSNEAAAAPPPPKKPASALSKLLAKAKTQQAKDRAAVSNANGVAAGSSSNVVVNAGGGQDLLHRVTSEKERRVLIEPIADKDENDGDENAQQSSTTAHPNNTSSSAAATDRQQTYEEFMKTQARAPRKGEIGISADDVSKIEALGYVMSGSRNPMSQKYIEARQREVHEKQAAKQSLDFLAESDRRADAQTLDDLFNLL